MATTLAPAIVYALGKQGKFVPNTHPSVTSAVREAERALAHGLPLREAIGFAVSKAEISVNHARMVRRVS